MKKLSFFFGIIFSKNRNRSNQAKFNVLAGFFLKGSNVLVSLFLVRIAINYLDTEKYGIWLTLSSILTWFTFFDVGLGNGLRNKFAQAVANGNIEKAKVYLSTTYAILIIVASIMVIFTLLFNRYIDFSELYNVSASLHFELRKLTSIVIILFSFRFFLQLISVVVFALQKSAVSNLFDFASNITIVILLLIITRITDGSLIYLGLIMGLSPIIVFTIASIILYSNNLRKYRPSIKYIRFRYSKDLITLGANFFLIQIAALILFASSNFIIAQLSSQQDVTKFNVVYKYFSVQLIIFSLILGPYWSAFTESFHKRDFAWIKNVMNKLKRIWLFMAMLTFIMILSANTIYKYWIGRDLEIPFTLNILMGIYIVIITWNQLFVNFINAVGKLQLQLYHSIFIICINIPLSIFFFKNLHLGLSGIVLSNILCQGIALIWTPLQYRLLITNSASGLWNK